MFTSHVLLFFFFLFAFLYFLKIRRKQNIDIIYRPKIHWFQLNSFTNAIFSSSVLCPIHLSLNVTLFVLFLDSQEIEHYFILFFIFTILKVLIKVFFFILETKQAIISFPSLPFSHYPYYSPFPSTSPIYSLERVIPPMGSLQSLRNQVEEGPSPHHPPLLYLRKSMTVIIRVILEKKKVTVTRKKKHKENIFFHKTQKCHFPKKNLISFLSVKSIYNCGWCTCHFQK